MIYITLNYINRYILLCDNNNDKTMIYIRPTLNSKIYIILFGFVLLLNVRHWKRGHTLPLIDINKIIMWQQQW